MNLSTKKKILKSSLIWQLILALIYIASLIFCFCYSNTIILLYDALYETDITVLFFTTTICAFIFFVTIIILLQIFIRKKINQNKDEFYLKDKKFKIISIITILFEPVSGILLTITAFSKDDGKDEIIDLKKQKKKKIIYPKPVQAEIKKLKRQRRIGLISEELYQKKYQKIIKNNS